MTTQKKQMTLFDHEEPQCKESWFSCMMNRLGVLETSVWPDAFGEALNIWNASCGKTPVKTLSLFSGAGGLDIGFHDAGFQIVECNEIESQFAATLFKNSEPGARLEGTNIKCLDIRKYNPQFDDIDFIIGGPPCQTFSAAGARAAGVNGTDDERGNLFIEYVRILERLKPQGFLFENVYRIIGAQGGKPWEQIQKAFQDVGYKLYWRVLDTADYGVPQFRERLIIVGLLDGTYMFPCPSHGPDSPDKRDYYNAGSAIDGLAPPTPKKILGGRHGYLLNDIPPGLNYSFYTDKMCHPQPIFGWRSKFSDYLYKADPTTPVRTIKAQGGQYTGPFHWEDRPFSLDELKRLQTFPDTYSIVGSRQKVIHQLGNSVPPQMGRILALSIMQQVFNREIPADIQCMSESYSLGFRARKRSLTKIYAKKAAQAIAKIPKECNPRTMATNGTMYGRLTEDLNLHYAKSDENADYTFIYTIDVGVWTIDISECNQNEGLNYKLIIRLEKQIAEKTGVQTIKLRSRSINITSILGLWKFLETIIKKFVHKDDLVQFFGYYQYRLKYSVDFEVLNQSVSKQIFWQVLSLVSKGRGIGKMLHMDAISHDYGIDNSALMKELINLKKLGFDIRNHNTNKQVQEGMILIPYCFPSLSDRSLQRLTGL